MKVAFYKYTKRPGLTGLFDAMIRRVTHGPYSHCELIFNDGSAYSASIQDGGCRFRWMSFDRSRWDIIDLPWVSYITQRMIENFCLDELYSGYDYPGVFRFLWPGIPESKNRWFCSEICCAALQQAGLLEGIKAWQVHPSRLHQLLTERS